MHFPRMLESVATGIAVVTVGYIVILAAVFLFQARLLFFPTRDITANPSHIGLDYEVVNFVTDDGVSLHGWYVPAEDSEIVVLFFHGNAGNISHRLETLSLFRRLGFNTLIFDYRGFGLSQGEITELGSYSDAAAARNYLVSTRKIPATEIIYFGRSLGGAIAAQLASRYPPKALILESSFTSVPDMAAEIYPFLPVRLLSRFAYDTKRIMPSVTCPVLIAHSRDDEIIPFEHGRVLFAAAGDPKVFLEMRGGHNDGFLTSGEDYNRGIKRFVEASVLDGNSRD